MAVKTWYQLRYRHDCCALIWLRNLLLYIGVLANQALLSVTVGGMYNIIQAGKNSLC